MTEKLLTGTLSLNTTKQKDIFMVFYIITDMNALQKICVENLLFY